MSDENSMAEKKELPETRVKVEYYADGELIDVTEGTAIVGTVITDGGQHAIAQGCTSNQDVANSARALVHAYLAMASGKGCQRAAKAMMLMELASWEDGKHE